MTSIHSNIEAARAIAERLIRRNAAVARATKSRDACLYELFGVVHEIDKQLQDMEVADAREMLKARYGVKLSGRPDSGRFAIKVAHPRLDARIQSKYAALLRFIRQKKRSDQSLRSFVRANGDIRGCVEEEKRLRDTKPRKHTKKR